MYATWLADVLRAAGCSVVEAPGWKDAGVGALATVSGVILHHTAGPATGNSPSLSLVQHGRPGLAGPLSQLFLARDGTFHVLAAGRANHAGRGEWNGITAGNSRMIGIEAENAGTGKDPWPDAQMHAYVIGVAAILQHIDAFPRMACGHKEYALPKGRKIDPTFDMDDFRDEVAKVMAAGNALPVQQPRPEDPVRSMLKRGDTGPSVKDLQFYLKIRGDGDFGPKTEAAVMAFQKAKGLKVDGIVGPATWKLLQA